MSSIPLPALSIKPPANPLDEFARIFQIKGMQQSQQLQAAQLQGVQTENQTKQLALQQETLATRDDQTWRNLMHDPNWDGTSDWLLKKGAPLVGPASLKTVAKGFADMGEAWAKLGKEQLGVQDALANHIGDQLQSVVDAKPADKLAAQQSAKQNAVTWINSTPGLHPAVRQGMLQGLQTIPDDRYIGDDAIEEHIAQTKLHAAIVDEGLKTAQTTQAAGKGAQAQAEADKITAQQNPQSPIYSPSAAAVAMGTAPGAQAIQAGEAKQAGAKAGAEAAAKFPWEARLEQMKQQGDPVFAYDPKNKQTVQVSRSEAQQSGFTNIVKVGQPEIDKAKTSAMQLGDATMNIQAYKQASQRMDELSGSDIATVSRVLGSDQFKAHFLGMELPVDWANELYRTKGWQDMPESAKDAVVNYIAARPAAISLLRAINPGVRLTESQIATELKNIPDPTTPSDIRDRQFTRLDRNIDQASKTLVKIPGVDLPSEIRDRLASQAGAEQAARASNAAREAAATGQYRNAGGNQMRVGQDAYDNSTKRYIGTVSKVYADGSYDVKPD